MKKSLSLLLAIAMVFSMFATVAAAATAEEQAAYSALEQAGVFVGREGGDAALDGELTRAEFASIIARLTGVNSDSPATFDDVPATHWATKVINAVVQAGYMQGTGDNKFEPSRNVTLQEVIAVAVRILGLEVDENATVEGAHPSVQKYIAAALAAGLIQEQADYTAPATRGQLAVVALTVYEQLQGIVKVTGAEAISSTKVVVTFSDGGQVEVDLDEPLKPGSNTITVTYQDKEYSVDVEYNAPAVSAKVVGAKKLEVAFNQAVDTSKVTFSIKRGSNSVTIASTSWSEDKTKATIELASKFISGDHELTVSGLGDAVSVKFTAEAERVADIEIINDVAPLIDGNDANNVADDALQVNYKVTNQYGEDITSITTLEASSSGGTVTLYAANGYLTIQSTGTFTLDSVVSLTLIHVATSTVETKTFKVGQEAKAASVTVKQLYHADNKTLTADSTLAEFYLVVEAKDQYGNVITNANKLDSEMLVSVSNTNVASVKGYASNRADFDVLNINGENKTVLQLAGTPSAGTSVVTLIAAGVGGSSATYTITVAEGVKTNEITFGDVGIVGAGETVKLPVIVTDLDGNEITDVAVLNSASKGVSMTLPQSVPAGATFKKDGNKIVFEFTAPATKGPITISALTKNNKYAFKTIDVQDEANPAVITGLDDVKVLIFKGQTLTLTYDKLIAEDQYGRTMSDNEFAADLADATLASGDYQVVVSDTSDNYITLTGTVLDNNGTSVVLNGANKGSESITFKLQKYNGTAWEDVAGSQLTVTFRTVELGELSSFGVEDPAKVYNNAAYNVELSVFGQTSDGKKVTLPASEYTVVSKNGKVTVTGNVLSSVGLNFGDATEVEDVVIVTITATGDIVEKAVVATKAAPAVNVLEVRENNTKVTAITLDPAAVGGTFDIADIAGKLYAKDQYGKEPAINATTGVITFADGSTANPRLTISGLVDGKADGNAPTIANNGLSTASISNVGNGDSFNLVITVGSQQTETIKVTISN